MLISQQSTKSSFNHTLKTEINKNSENRGGSGQTLCSTLQTLIVTRVIFMEVVNCPPYYFNCNSIVPVDYLMHFQCLGQLDFKSNYICNIKQ